MAAAAGVTDEGTLIFSAWPDTCTAVNEVQKGPEQEEIDNFCCSEGTTNTLGVFPQTEAVWALGKEDLCVHFTPSPREGDTKPHGGHQDFRWPHTRGTATSSFPKPQPLCIDSGCRIRCDPTRHRLETCRDALAQTTSLLGFGFLAPSARPHHRGSMFTCHVHLLLAVPQFYVTSQVTSTPCISVPLPKIFLTHISFEAAAGLLGAICRANPQLIPSSGAAAMKYRLRDLRHFQIWS